MSGIRPGPSLPSPSAYSRPAGRSSRSRGPPGPRVREQGRGAPPPLLAQSRPADLGTRTGTGPSPESAARRPAPRIPPPTGISLPAWHLQRWPPLKGVSPTWPRGPPGTASLAGSLASRPVGDGARLCGGPLGCFGRPGARAASPLHPQKLGFDTGDTRLALLSPSPSLQRAKVPWIGR